MYEDPKEYITTAGVPQGPVLVLLLWNILYNEVLVVFVPEEATIVNLANGYSCFSKEPRDCKGFRYGDS